MSEHLPTEEQVARAIQQEAGWNGYVILDTLAQKLARAVLALLPQRVAPSRDEVVGVLLELARTPHASFGEQADAILTLYASAPTVAEVKAEAWDEAIGAAADALDEGRAIYELPNPYWQEADHA